MWPLLDAATQVGAAPSPKMLALRALALQIVGKGGRPLVLLKRPDHVNYAADLLREAGLTVATLQSDEAQSLRLRTLRDFTARGSGIDVLVCTLAVGGTGLNLQSCNAVVTLNTPQDASAEGQGIKRVWRHGVRGPVAVFRITTAARGGGEIVAREEGRGGSAAGAGGGAFCRPTAHPHQGDLLRGLPAVADARRAV